MNIGIIGAMDVEINKLKEHIKKDKVNHIAGFEFFEGTFNGNNIVLAISNEGKVNSAICTEIMCINYKLDLILNVGVAGAIVESINPLDTIISSNTVEFDFDTTALGYEKGYVFGLNEVYMKCDNENLESLKNAAMKYSNTYVGTIASSDKFVVDALEKKKINEDFGAIAVDMESASICHVCNLNKNKFIALRIVSDSGDNIEYRKFLELATNKLTQIVVDFLNNV